MSSSNPSCKLRWGLLLCCLFMCMRYEVEKRERNAWNFGSASAVVQALQYTNTLCESYFAERLRVRVAAQLQGIVRVVERLDLILVWDSG